MAAIEESQNGGGIYMFAGKGGVGKTTCAATTALHYSSRGWQTLAISTDATPSLAHIFEVSDKKKPVRVMDSLFVNELGLKEVEEMWDMKFGREVYSVFSTLVSIDYNAFVEFMSSMLPGLSDEFMIDYIRELKRSGRYQTIIWDTAPLGQTLALLGTPAMLVEHLNMAPRVYSRLKMGQNSQNSILDILKRWQKLSTDSIDFLLKEVTFNLVAIPEALAFEQLGDIFQEINRFGFTITKLIINNVVVTTDSAFLAERAKQQQKYLDIIHERYASLEIVELPMLSTEVKGIDRLREFERNLFREQSLLGGGVSLRV
jgi:arsenite-transporting ATPase